MGATFVASAMGLVLQRLPAAVMLAGVKRLMERLKLRVNARKTRCLRCSKEALDSLGYDIGWNCLPTDGSRYIGTRPSKASVQSICCGISEQTDRRYECWSAEGVVKRLNRMLSYGHRVTPDYFAASRRRSAPQANSVSAPRRALPARRLAVFGARTALSTDY